MPTAPRQTRDKKPGSFSDFCSKATGRDAALAEMLARRAPLVGAASSPGGRGNAASTRARPGIVYGTEEGGANATSGVTMRAASKQPQIRSKPSADFLSKFEVPDPTKALYITRGPDGALKDLPSDPDSAYEEVGREKVIEKARTSKHEQQPPRVSRRAGYVQPGRAGTKALVAYIDEALLREFKRVAEANGTTMQDMVRGLVVGSVAANKNPKEAARLRQEIVERQQLLSALLSTAPRNTGK